MEPRLAGQRLQYGYLADPARAHYGTSPAPQGEGSDPHDNIVGLHPMWEYSNPNYTKVSRGHTTAPRAFSPRGVWSVSSFGHLSPRL